MNSKGKLIKNWKELPKSNSSTSVMTQIEEGLKQEEPVLVWKSDFKIS